MSDLVTVLFVLLIVALLLGGINQMVPFDVPTRRMLNVLVLVALVVWLLVFLLRIAGVG